mmetsp:Transcript_55219/g.161139  ORF Transcript_55219/g.161139 Transcript_55219/m.161139 type:complete len:236 (+) Transcript_55219:935-1642(+)
MLKWRMGYVTFLKSSVQPGSAPLQRPPWQSDAGSNSFGSLLPLVDMILRKPVVSSGASSSPPSMGNPLGTPTLSTLPRKRTPAPRLKWRFFLLQLCWCWPATLSHFFLKAAADNRLMGVGTSLGVLRRLVGALGTTTKGSEYISCSSLLSDHAMRTTAWSPTAKPRPICMVCAKLQGASPADMPPMAMDEHFMVTVCEWLAIGSNTCWPTFRYETKFCICDGRTFTNLSGCTVKK